MNARLLLASKRLAPRCALRPLLACIAVLLTAAAGPVAAADNPPGTKAKDAAAKDSAAKPAAKEGVSTGGDRKQVGEGDQLGFRQQKVAAEMSELEERMFRLSEAIKALEPENSSRLMMGLRFAREQLIVHQMKEVEQELARLALSDAANRQKALLAKLQQLQDLLLSTDLDFQMRLERLRMMREALKRIELAIKEEGRELKQSGEASAAERQRDALQKRKLSLEELIQQQTGHVGKAEALGGADAPGEAEQKESTELGTRQDATRKATETLAGDKSQPGDPRALGEAAGKMAGAAKNLGDKKPKDALPEMKQALDLLKQELDNTDKQLQKAEQMLAAERFAGMKKDQQGNRQLTEGITEITKQLGESGQNATAGLQRASGSMSKAEQDLANIKPTPASQQQDQALQALKDARSELSEEEQKLLEQLRAEVKKRVIEALTLMLERQVAIRKTTESLAPRAKQAVRQAVTSVVALAKQEQALVEMANEIITLVEETEFGIALPAALGVVRDEMEGVKGSLGRGDASEPVVAAEKQIEDDLRALMEAMKQLPPQRPPNNRSRPSNLDEQERELNRLVAELKMIRILQIRLNTDTTGLDKRRGVDAAALSAEIRQRIEDLQGRQEDIRDVTERLSAARGDELQQ